jgi:hypothetical protein
MKLAILFATIGAMTTVAGAAPGTPTTWSTTTEGIRARLVLAPASDAQKRPQISVAFEIENTSDTSGGLALPWGYEGTMLKLTLEDEAGKPVASAPQAGSHASGPPYVVLLPERSTLRVVVTPAAIEYVSATRQMLRPFTFQSWELPAKRGKLYLRGTLTPHAQPTKSAARGWTKPIELPRVELP